jgi:hypothetical protein
MSFYNTISLTFSERNTSGEMVERMEVSFTLISDFANGCPAYFDVYVHKTLQPGNPNGTSLNAGAAAVAGEI